MQSAREWGAQAAKKSLENETEVMEEEAEQLLQDEQLLQGTAHNSTLQTAHNTQQHSTQQHSEYSSIQHIAT